MNVSDATELEHAISTVRWAVEKAISIVSRGPYGNRVDEPQFVTLDIVDDTVIVKWPSAHFDCGSPVVEAESISIPIARLLMTETELGAWEGAVCTLDAHIRGPRGSTRRSAISGRKGHKASPRLVPQRKVKGPESLP